MRYGIDREIVANRAPERAVIFRRPKNCWPNQGSAGPQPSSNWTIRDIRISPLSIRAETTACRPVGRFLFELELRFCRVCGLRVQPKKRYLVEVSKSILSSKSTPLKLFHGLFLRPLVLEICAHSSSVQCRVRHSAFVGRQCPSSSLFRAYFSVAIS